MIVTKCYLYYNGWENVEVYLPCFLIGITVI